MKQGLVRICATTIVFASAVCSTAGAATLSLAKGVGVHEWLNWSPLNHDGSYRWPPYRSQDEWRAAGRHMSDWPAGDEFKRIRSLGFDFVRLSVDPGPLLASTGEKRVEALTVLENAVSDITSSGLKVVFNLHSVSQIPAYDITILYDGAGSPGVAKYRDVVKDVTVMLSGFDPHLVALEPFNEPAFYPCTDAGTEEWQDILASTIKDIRAINEKLTIVATGACGGSISGLVDLNPTFDDPNILYSFHMYEPHSFTHQRPEEAGDFTAALPWPAKIKSESDIIASLKRTLTAAGLNKLQQAAELARSRGAIDEYFAAGWGENQMQARIAEATNWARAHKIDNRRLFMGEFGAMLLSDDQKTGTCNQDRLRYIATLRTIAEGAGIPWSVWEYANPYGMTVIQPQGEADPDIDLLRALGLSEVPASRLKVQDRCIGR